MKKILSLVMVIAMIAALAVTTSAAEISTDGLIGHFKLDGDLVNAVDGTEGTPYGSGSMFGEALYTDLSDPDRYWVLEGVEGNAFFCGDADGFGTNVNPGDNDFTVGFWLTVPSAESGYVPYMWYGERSQGTGYYTTERWLGVWNVDTGNVFGGGSWATSYGPFVGSNDAAGARLQVEPADNYYDLEGDYLLQWTHVVVSAVQVEGATEEDVDTYTVTLYINGVPVDTTEGLPDPYTGDPETYGDYIYFNGVNAWGDKPSCGGIDEVVIYNRALGDDDVAALYSAYATPATFATADDFNAIVAGLTAEEEPETTAAPETEEPADDTTAAPEAEDTAPDTTAAPETDATEEGGCGSSMGAAALVALVATLGCAIVKKH